MAVRSIFAAAILFISTTAPAQPAAPTLEQRVQRIEDELAIRRVIVEYAVRLDAKDLDAYLDLFARDGTWQTGNSVRKGHAQIREMLAGLYKNPKIERFGYERYRIVSNIQIDVNGDRATARSRHLSLMRGSKGNPVPTLGGLYEDDFIREDGKWKILRRVDYPIMPTAEEWRKQLSELLAQPKQ